MKPAEAANLLRLLRAAHPRTTLSAETTELWLTTLRQLDAKSGAKTVDSLLHAVKFFPSLAELHEDYAIVREQAARDRRAVERRQQLEALDEMELPPLAEILRRFPEVQKMVEGEAVALPEAGDGECDDCKRKRRKLYRFAKLRLCPDCARPRLRVRDDAAAKGGEVAA